MQKKFDCRIVAWTNVKKAYDSLYQEFIIQILEYLNPIPHGVFWITHTWGGHILPGPCNTAILKDMDLKFEMLK